MARKFTKKKIIKLVSQYGLHIWAIVIIANAVIAYAFHFSTHAAFNDTSIMQAVPGDSGTPSDVSPTPNKSGKPLGPTISLTFAIPGIGSGSANMTPVHLERNVTFFLYAPDANSLNKSVKPLYTIKTKADYDTNTLSPTYTSYVIKNFDLGPDVKKGQYQIAFSTDQSLRTLIKSSPTDVGGRVFDLRNSARVDKISQQKVLMGDTVPAEGDNIVDVSDYNVFVQCYGDGESSDFCKPNSYGDFDDNGVVDGIDYNLLLRSFGQLLQQGQDIPKITAVPTQPQRISRLSNLTTPTQAVKKPSPTQAVTQTTKSSGGSAIGGILFFVFVLILGAGIFILLKTNPSFKSKIMGILHKSPTGTPPKDPNTPEGQAATPPADPNAATPSPEQTPAPSAPAEGADPNAVAASTEIPVPPPATTPPAETQTPPADASAIAASTEIPVGPPATLAPQAPAQTSEPTAGDAVEKECYVKKVGPDDAGTGVWLRLTDDNGALEAHYSKADVTDGFAKVKGTMKSENGKNFLEVSELAAEG